MEMDLCDRGHQGKRANSRVKTRLPDKAFDLKIATYPAFFSKSLCRITCVGRNVFYEQKEDN